RRSSSADPDPPGRRDQGSDPTDPGEAAEGAGVAAIAKDENPPPPPAGQLAWLQTRMALERTLLAWARTGAALIGFGFTIFHFFEALNRSPEVAPARIHGSARWFGISLVAVGTLAMIFAMVQYFALVRYLEGETFRGVADYAGVPRL